MNAKAIVVSMVLLAGNAHAITMFGQYDCAQWFSHKRYAEVWLMGFLSSMNYHVGSDDKKYDPLGKLNSADQAFLWMDNYCKRNPLKSVTDGALELYQELQRGAR